MGVHLGVFKEMPFIMSSPSLLLLWLSYEPCLALCGMQLLYHTVKCIHYSSNTMAGSVCSALYIKAYIKYYKPEAIMLSCLSACWVKIQNVLLLSLSCMSCLCKCWCNVLNIMYIMLGISLTFKERLQVKFDFGYRTPIPTFLSQNNTF